MVLRAPVSLALRGIASLSLDGQGPDRGSGIEPKQNGNNCEFGCLGNFREGKKALHKISFLCISRLAFHLSLAQPSHGGGGASGARLCHLPLLSLFRCIDMHQNVLALYVREQLSSIGMGSVNLVLSIAPASYLLKTERNIRTLRSLNSRWT